MKVKYTPGENGLMGKTYKVEIVAIQLHEVRHIDQPILAGVKIKSENGKSQWITGQKLFDSIDMIQKAVSKKVV